MFKWDRFKTLINPLKVQSTDPMISVFLRTHPEYNKKGFVGRAFQSILNQDLPLSFLQIIISNDGPLGKEEEDFFQDLLSNTPIPAWLMGTEEASGYFCFPSNIHYPYASAPYVSYLDADNEYSPSHLSSLLTSIRQHHPVVGWPHFTYSRINYIRAPEAKPNLPDGPGPFIPWTPSSIQKLLTHPLNNFIDSSSFLISRGSLQHLLLTTGRVWNQDKRRFGDWELFTRLIRAGARGIAVDNPSLVYHWHGRNIQTTRSVDSSSVIMVPGEVLDKLEKMENSYAG
jgi:hypothetical protein